MKRRKHLIVIALLICLLAGILPASSVRAGTGLAIVLNHENLSMTAGDTEQLTMYIGNYPSSPASWKSSNKSVAKVSSSGKVTAKKAGTAVISCPSGYGFDLSCTVTVKAAAKKKAYITNKNFRGTFDLNGKGSFESGWYSIIIDKITKKGNVRFQLTRGSRNGGRLADSPVLKAKVKGKKMTFTIADDGWGNTCQGKIVFNKNKTITMAVKVTKKGSLPFYGLDLKKSKFIRTSKKHALAENM